MWHILSKWKKTNALLVDGSLRRFIPTTRQFSEHHLRSLLHKYGLVYVKPDIGTYGMGVMRVEQHREKDQSRYRCRWGNNQSVSFRTFEELHTFLRGRIRNRRYLIQKGIELLQYNDRRFDLRVMVQRDGNRRWVASGIIGRLAHPDKVVTNYHSGGQPIDADILLAPHLKEQETERLLDSLRTLSMQAANQLGRAYPRIREVGVDIALDALNRPWILEINTMPDPYIFRKCRDRSVFARVYRLHRRHLQRGSKPAKGKTKAASAPRREKAARRKR